MARSVHWCSTEKDIHATICYRISACHFPCSRVKVRYILSVKPFQEPEIHLELIIEFWLCSSESGSILRFQTLSHWSYWLPRHWNRGCSVFLRTTSGHRCYRLIIHQPWVAKITPYTHTIIWSLRAFSLSSSDCKIFTFILVMWRCVAWM